MYIFELFCHPTKHPIMIKEDFLHYVWDFKKFDLKNLKTTTNKELRILNFGHKNKDAGPDFINAKVQLDEVTWFGNIEIHIKASDWKAHRHTIDPAYSNVILHVVLINDIPVEDINGNSIPCLEIRERIEKTELRKYYKFLGKGVSLPCSSKLESIPQIIKVQATENASVLRLRKKADYVRHILHKTEFNWEYTFKVLLSRYFGGPVNADAFEMMALSLNPLILLKEKEKLTDLEALLFGQASFLMGVPKDAYMEELKNIYTFQKRKYNLIEISPASWKFMRMRPYSFPTIRIAQLAYLFHINNSFVDHIRAHTSLSELKQLFKGKTSAYWSDHYLFGKTSKYLEKQISSTFIDLLLINVVAPFVYAYGNLRNEEKYLSLSLSLLENIPPENNVHTRNWKKLGISATNAFETQGLIELKKSFCDKKKCLKCPIGYKIMRSDK